MPAGAKCVGEGAEQDQENGRSKDADEVLLAGGGAEDADKAANIKNAESTLSSSQSAAEILLQRL